MRRDYTGSAQAAQLTEDLGSSTANLTIVCDDLTGWPTGTGGKPFFIVIDRGKANEEKILCASRADNILTVYDDGLTNGRGADDTNPTAHTANAVVEHVFTATDADEANAHVNNPVPHITQVTSSTRPNPANANQVILETDTGALLAYLDSAWTSITGAGATGGGTNRVFYENDTLITANYTITSGKNAGTFGPVTIATGVTVTIPGGSVWTVV